ncbi:hypothetical protein MESS4_160027 [Mesorhizobium sp. STM 4661]|nr:hypothetical protein MESS4_160027 [Mesorhizobium sp. STM 4661]
MPSIQEHPCQPNRLSMQKGFDFDQSID